MTIYAVSILHVISEAKILSHTNINFKTPESKDLRGVDISFRVFILERGYTIRYLLNYIMNVISDYAF